MFPRLAFLLLVSAVAPLPTGSQERVSEASDRLGGARVVCPANGKPPGLDSPVIKQNAIVLRRVCLLWTVESQSNRNRILKCQIARRRLLTHTLLVQASPQKADHGICAHHALPGVLHVDPRADGNAHVARRRRLGHFAGTRFPTLQYRRTGCSASRSSMTMKWSVVRTSWPAATRDARRLAS